MEGTVMMQLYAFNSLAVQICHMCNGQLQYWTLSYSMPVLYILQYTIVPADYKFFGDVIAHCQPALSVEDTNSEDLSGRKKTPI